MKSFKIDQNLFPKSWYSLFLVVFYFLKYAYCYTSFNDDKNIILPLDLPFI